MLRNSKPKITHLTEETMKLLNDMGFSKYQDSLHRPIDNINIKAFYKSYSCCGGRFCCSCGGCRFGIGGSCRFSCGSGGDRFGCSRCGSCCFGSCGRRCGCGGHFLSFRYRHFL